MKRLAIGLEALAERSNLELACWKAARGKTARPAVARFLAEREVRLEALAASILDGSAPQGRASRFVIHDPKRRVIHAACFADRVLHHAIFRRFVTICCLNCWPGVLRGRVFWRWWRALSRAVRPTGWGVGCR